MVRGTGTGTRRRCHLTRLLGTCSTFLLLLFDFDLFFFGSDMYVDCNNNLHRTRKIDDSVSGTTAASAWVEGNVIKVANIGDSRVIVGRRNGGSGGGGGEGESKEQGKAVKYKAIALSNDQTPYRRDERERIKKTGARVMTYDMLEGKAPFHENWDHVELGVGLDEGGDPPRVWAKDGKYPGNAFTRSIGDKISECMGEWKLWWGVEWWVVVVFVVCHLYLLFVHVFVVAGAGAGVCRFD